MAHEVHGPAGLVSQPADDLEQTIDEDVGAFGVPADRRDPRPIADAREPRRELSEITAPGEKAVDENDGCTVTALNAVASIHRRAAEREPLSSRERFAKDRRPRSPLSIVDEGLRSHPGGQDLTRWTEWHPASP